MSKFTPGRSGNPDGRPKGSKDRRTAFRALLEPKAPALFSTAIELALKGDTTALKMCLDRLVPSLKAETATVLLPGLAEASSLTDQGRIILAAVAEGRLAPDRATMLLGAMAAHSKTAEIEDIGRRLAALEARRDDGPIP